MSNLYEINEKYRALQDMLEDGEIDAEAILTTLEDVEDELQAKLDNTAHIVKNLKHLSAGIDEQIRDAQTRKRGIESNIKQINNRLMWFLDSNNMKKYASALNVISIMNGRQSVEVADVDELALHNPELVKVTKSAMKKEIGALLKQGEYVAGCKLVTGERTVTIK